MIRYWLAILTLFLRRKFQSPLRPDQSFTKSFRVGPFDCDGLRVMTAYKYTVYMDLIRWEIIARSGLFKAIIRRGLAPTLGSQKLIYRRPLKIWSKFEIELEPAGWDEKWLYHVHYFRQDGMVKAVGITRSLIWKKDVPHALENIMRDATGDFYEKRAPDWVLQLFENDSQILNKVSDH